MPIDLWFVEMPLMNADVVDDKSNFNSRADVMQVELQMWMHLILLFDWYFLFSVRNSSDILH